MERLKHLREAAGLTKVKLAEEAEKALPDLPFVRIRPEYLTDIETGRNKNPNALMVLRLADVLGCDPKDLYRLPKAVLAAA